MNGLGLDLNGEGGFCDPAKHNFAGTIDEPRQAGVRATDAASSADHVSPLCDPVSRRTQGQVVLLPGSVPEYGVCAADLSRKSARHRSVSARSAVQAVSPRNSLDGRAQYSGQRERRTRLAHLCRLRAEPDRHRSATVCERALWCRPEGIGLRTGHDHHRSVPVGVSVGAIPLGQGGGQTAHAARSARQHPDLHPYQRRQDARGQHPRSVVAGGRCVLHHGSGLPRLRAPVSLPRPAASSSPVASRISRPSVATRIPSIVPRD